MLKDTDRKAHNILYPNERQEGDGVTITTTRIFTIIAVLVLCSAGVPAVLALEQLWTYPAGSAELGGVDISADGNTIIVAAGKLWVFTRAGNLTQKEPYGETIIITPDGKFAMSSYSSGIYYYQLQATKLPGERKLVKSWQFDNIDPVRTISLSDDGNMSVSALRGMTVLVIDPWEKAAYPNNNNVTNVFQVSADGKYIVGLSLESIRLFTVQGDEAVMSDIKTSTEPHIMALSSTGLTAVFDDGQKIRCVNTIDGTERWNTAVSGVVTSLVMPSTDTSVIAGTDSGNLYSFDMNGKLEWEYATNPEKNQLCGIEEIAVSRTAASVAAVTRDGKFVLLDSRGNTVGSVKLGDRLKHVAMSEDSTIAVATGDKGIYAYPASPSAIAARETTAMSTIDELETTPEFAPLETFTAGPTVTDTTTVTEITAIPTEYSVIRKTQSPVPGIVPILAIMITIFCLFRKTRNG